MVFHHLLRLLEKKSCTCETTPGSCTIHPAPVKPLPSQNKALEDDTRRHSGVGILEFTPARAGQDVTPLNLDFKDSPAVSPKLPTSRLSKFCHFKAWFKTNNHG